MDTSETYIKMRLAAIPDLGRGTSHGKPSYYFTERAWVDVYGNWYYTDKMPCQLERQDQLQAMVVDRYYKPTKYISMWLFFNDWLEENILNDEYVPKAEYQVYSMEQLWLAFVMKEKFNKTWNGSEWTSG